MNAEGNARLHAKGIVDGLSDRAPWCSDREGENVDGCIGGMESVAGVEEFFIKKVSGILDLLIIAVDRRMNCAMGGEDDAFEVHFFAGTEFDVRNILALENCADAVVADYVSLGIVGEDFLKRFDMEMVGVFVADDDIVDVVDAVLLSRVITGISEKANSANGNDEAAVAEFGDGHGS